MDFKRFYRYDFASTRILIDQVTKYYGIAISAQILSYTPTSVVQLLHETKKPFFIDPMTFVFARDIDNICRNNKIRKSYQKLIEDYGEPFTNCASGTGLTPSQFKKGDGEFDLSLINKVCRNLLSYQTKKFGVAADFTKYNKLLKKGISSRGISPSFLVAPYFYANQYGDDYYKLSLTFAQESKKIKGSFDLYPVICISKEILWNEPQIVNLVKDYVDFDGYMIWIDSLDEETIIPQQLIGLKSLIEKLSAYRKPIYFMYGGFLCDLLSKFGLSGYSSGICYGEKRSVDAVGGGAGNRYYIPFVHLKISEDLANAFFARSNKNKSLMCTCPICSKIHNYLPPSLDSQTYSGRFFSEMDFLDYRRHFLNVKYEEMTDIETMTNAQINLKLDSDIQKLIDIDRFPGQPSELDSRHLRLWKILFS
jgi:hypothetical protein